MAWALQALLVLAGIFPATRESIAAAAAGALLFLVGVAGPILHTFFRSHQPAVLDSRIRAGPVEATPKEPPSGRLTRALWGSTQAPLP
jgi:hypothetical protein